MKKIITRTKTMNKERFRKVRTFWKFSALFLSISSTFFLTACDDNQPVTSYDSVSSCLESSSTSDQKNKCTEDYNSALAQNDKVAPKYNSSSSCESDFGTNQCQYSSTSMHWIPIMSGFTQSYGSNYSQPLYSSKQSTSPMYGKFVDASGNSFGTYGAKTTTQVSSSALAPKSATTTVTRSGFGSTVSSRSASGFSSGHSSGG